MGLRLPGTDLAHAGHRRGFGQPIRRIFEPFFKIESEVPMAFDTHPKYCGRSDDKLWFMLYLPIARLTEQLSAWLRCCSTGASTCT